MLSLIILYFPRKHDKINGAQYLTSWLLSRFEKIGECLKICYFEGSFSMWRQLSRIMCVVMCWTCWPGKGLPLDQILQATLVSSFASHHSHQYTGILDRIQRVVQNIIVQNHQVGQFTLLYRTELANHIWLHLTAVSLTLILF